MRAGAYDAALAATGLWWVAGLHVDGWAHSHLGAELESFLTPWHAVLYSGFAATSAVAVAAALRPPHPPKFWQARPSAPGIRWTLLGLAVFAAGGAADLAWHTLFGVEASVEALYSPTHLVLAAGLALAVSHPLRAALARRRSPAKWAQAGAAVVSAALLLSVLTFFTQGFHPWVRPWAAAGQRPVDPVWAFEDPVPPFPDTPGGIPSADVAHVVGIASFLVQAALLAGLLVAMLRRGPWPPGSFTVLVGLNATLTGLMRDLTFLIPAAVLAGAFADVLSHRLRVRPGRGGSIRAVAALVPVVLYTLYFASVAWWLGLWWSVHLWAGAVAVAGLAGLLVGILGAPGGASEP